MPHRYWFVISGGGEEENGYCCNDHKNLREVGMKYRRMLGRTNTGSLVSSCLPPQSFDTRRSCFRFAQAVTSPESNTWLWPSYGLKPSPLGHAYDESQSSTAQTVREPSNFLQLTAH